MSFAMASDVRYLPVLRAAVGALTAVPQRDGKQHCGSRRLSIAREALRVRRDRSRDHSDVHLAPGRPRECEDQAGCLGGSLDRNLRVVVKERLQPRQTVTVLREPQWPASSWQQPAVMSYSYGEREGGLIE